MCDMESRLQRLVNDKPRASDYLSVVGGINNKIFEEQTVGKLNPVRLLNWLALLRDLGLMLRRETERLPELKAPFYYFLTFARIDFLLRTIQRPDLHDLLLSTVLELKESVVEAGVAVFLDSFIAHTLREEKLSMRLASALSARFLLVRLGKGTPLADLHKVTRLLRLVQPDATPLSLLQHLPGGVDPEQRAILGRLLGEPKPRPLFAPKATSTPKGQPCQEQTPQKQQDVPQTLQASTPRRSLRLQEKSAKARPSTPAAPQPLRLDSAVEAPPQHDWRPSPVAVAAALRLVAAPEVGSCRTRPAKRRAEDAGRPEPQPKKARQPQPPSRASKRPLPPTAPGDEDDSAPPAKRGRTAAPLPAAPSLPAPTLRRSSRSKVALASAAIKYCLKPLRHCATWHDFEHKAEYNPSLFACR